MPEKSKGTDAPRNFEQAAARIREKIEAPVLAEGQAALWHSGYVDGAGKALALLEKAGQDKNAVVPGIAGQSGRFGSDGT
ncbi:hypothetical protein [Desulfotomaculum copahuensis]|uniref:Uncharacterized protein n=1 Tax=Desulfotomaculum copahuensis TaxID=1838280 RepID=A0A1B7LF33_9FIRM|nr:hypothetical protein [Desulfotomaculum copahuensis]OAT82250.1 hypothetical protein A6M21_08780 [Desulfotomaculum copahuensis]